MTNTLQNTKCKIIQTKKQTKQKLTHRGNLNNRFNRLSSEYIFASSTLKLERRNYISINEGNGISLYILNCYLSHQHHNKNNKTIKETKNIRRDLCIQGNLVSPALIL